MHDAAWMWPALLWNVGATCARVQALQPTKMRITQGAPAPMGASQNEMVWVGGRRWKFLWSAAFVRCVLVFRAHISRPRPVGTSANIEALVWPR